MPFYCAFHCVLFNAYPSHEIGQPRGQALRTSHVLIDCTFGKVPVLSNALGPGKIYCQMLRGVKCFVSKYTGRPTRKDMIGIEQVIYAHF